MRGDIKEKVVLITGASSGIGKAIAHEFMVRGNRVYGTSRKAVTGSRIYPDSVSTEPEFNKKSTLTGSMGDKGIVNNTPGATGFIEMIQMDVRSEDSVKNAIDYVSKKEGRIDILINNAGFGIAGAIEDTTFDEAFSQFDTNFFGVLRVLRNVVPVMRRRGEGLIINISSVAGLISIPFQSMYSASKFALEAMSEALRIELKPFGIKVVIIEPGDTNTGFTDNRVIVKGARKGSVYYEKFKKSINTMIKDEKNGPGPETVAKAVIRTAKKKNPPVRVAVGMSYKLIVILKRILPDKFVHFILEKIY
ncbi:MAG TPA: SDR family oxidoreductase [Clostridiaceae bacterium]|nr:SDR family oxidoreductase [Clostridiaceae bacterium]